VLLWETGRWMNDLDWLVNSCHSYLHYRVQHSFHSPWRRAPFTWGGITMRSYTFRENWPCFNDYPLEDAEIRESLDTITEMIPQLYIMQRIRQWAIRYFQPHPPLYWSEELQQFVTIPEDWEKLASESGSRYLGNWGIPFILLRGNNQGIWNLRKHILKTEKNILFFNDYNGKRQRGPFLYSSLYVRDDQIRSIRRRDI